MDTNIGKSKFYASVLTFFFLWIQTTVRSATDSDLDTVQLLIKNGYPAEGHKIVTEDGYVLTLHRIPYSTKSPLAPNKPVVLLLHGMLACSADFVVLGPGKSEAYIHADNGYDVWIINFRGNIHSRQHMNLSTSSDEYWNFSFHEMGIYDAPASIDYVLKRTGQNKLYISALSLGTTAFFIMASSRPQYNKKIRLMTAAAPVARIKLHPGSILTTRMSEFVVDMLHITGVKAIVNIQWILNFVAEFICNTTITRPICTMMVYQVAGYDPGELEEDKLPIIVSHLSGGISVKTLKHLVQIYKSGKFQTLDYGMKQNLAIYKQETPPQYNVSAITAPVALLYGLNDPLAQTYNAIWMNKTLGNCVELYKVPRRTFSHFGFIYGKDSKSLVYDEVSRLLKLY